MLTAIVVSSVLGGCAGAGDAETLQLEPYLQPCQGLVLASCMVATSEGSLFYDGIEGFTFEWGYRSVLRVRTRHIANPPADGSSIAHELRELESKTAVEPGTRFELNMFAVTTPEEAASIFEGDCTEGVALFSRSSTTLKRLSFDSSAACETFLARLGSDVPETITLEFGAPSEPLKVIHF